MPDNQKCVETSLNHLLNGNGPSPTQGVLQTKLPSHILNLPYMRINKFCVYKWPEAVKAARLYAKSNLQCKPDFFCIFDGKCFVCRENCHPLLHYTVDVDKLYFVIISGEFHQSLEIKKRKWWKHIMSL